MKFTHLASRPDLCNQIAQLTYKEWPDMYKKFNIKNVTEWTNLLKKNYCNKEYFPAGYIITDDDGNLIAFAALDLNGAFKDPIGQERIWLSNLYVLKNFRNKGVATSIVDKLSTILKEKYNRNYLYLWLHNPDMHYFYSNIGFNIIELKTIEGYDFTIYKKDTTPKEPSIIQLHHVLGFIIIIIIIFFIRKLFSFICWALGIFQPKNVVVKVE